MTRAIVVRVVWAGALVTLAATAFSPAYAGRTLALPAIVPLSLGAVLLAVILALVTARLSLPRWTVALAVTVLTSVALSLVIPNVLDAIPRLLTAPRPAPTSPDNVAPVVAVVFVAAVVACLAEVRPRATAAAVAPAAAGLIYLLGALLAAGKTDSRGLVALTLVLLTAVGWILLPRDAPAPTTASDSPSSRRPLRATVTALIASAATALLVAPLAGLGSVRPDAFDPRSLVTTPRQDTQVLSPLPMLGVWADQTDLPLIEVTGRPPARLTLAVLPDFEGASWSNNGRFTVPGAAPVADLPTGATTLSYDLRVRVLGLGGGWVPSAGIPTAIDLDEVRVDADSGAVVALEGLREDRRYRLTGQVAAADDAVLAGAAVPAADVASRYLRTPQIPAAFATYARSGVARATTRLEQAVALEELVRSGRRFSPKAPSGSSYAHLEQFLFPASGSSVGTSEQFAASYVLLARSVGLPSRLVVGLQLPEGATTPVTLTGGTVQAWPEIYFSDVGWVPFDPTPTQEGSARSAPRQQLLDRLGETADADDNGDDTATPNPQRGPESRLSSLSAQDRTLLLGAAVVLIALLLVLALAVARQRRRLRLRRLGALGAWQQQIDALVLAGTPPTPPESATVIAGRVAGEHPSVAESAGALLVRAEHAAYAPQDSTAWTGDDSWEQAVAITTAIRRAAPWWRRAIWWCDPRVFRRGRPRG
ncbi:transglutaminaseTgpA domain-containing protein [Knoellia sp. CPCC 206453]|uniref:transglutaminaseTgpA domain-containing protein n=1 Tax=Knoellia pratensis TaxID=3404796 RepID=UPI00360913F5